MIHITRYNPENDADFYIQSVGVNAGRVLDTPSANCFAVKVLDTDRINPKYFYYFMINAEPILKSRARGTVIPFLRIEDIYQIVNRLANRSSQ